MQPAPLTRAPALAWLMAHAYAHRRFLAVLAYPLALAVTLTYQLRRGVYETDDRNGMVIVARWRPGIDAVLAITLILTAYAGLGLLAGLLSFVHPLLEPALFLLAGALGVAGALVLAQGQQSATPIAKDTPTSGDRWQVAALAQRPGTHLSALLLTRNVIAHVAPPPATSSSRPAPPTVSSRPTSAPASPPSHGAGFTASPDQAHAARTSARHLQPDSCRRTLRPGSTAASGPMTDAPGPGMVSLEQFLRARLDEQEPAAPDLDVLDAHRQILAAFRSAR